MFRCDASESNDVQQEKKLNNMEIIFAFFFYRKLFCYLDYRHSVNLL